MANFCNLFFILRGESFSGSLMNVNTNHWDHSSSCVIQSVRTYIISFCFLWVIPKAEQSSASFPSFFIRVVANHIILPYFPFLFSLSSFLHLKLSSSLEASTCSSLDFQSWLLRLTILLLLLIMRFVLSLWYISLCFSTSGCICPLVLAEATFFEFNYL